MTAGRPHLGPQIKTYGFAMANRLPFKRQLSAADRWARPGCYVFWSLPISSTAGLHGRIFLSPRFALPKVDFTSARAYTSCYSGTPGCARIRGPERSFTPMMATHSQSGRYCAIPIWLQFIARSRSTEPACFIRARLRIRSLLRFGSIPPLPVSWIKKTFAVIGPSNATPCVFLLRPPFGPTTASRSVAFLPRVQGQSPLVKFCRCLHHPRSSGKA